jgi:hypothetical protein
MQGSRILLLLFIALILLTPTGVYAAFSPAGKYSVTFQETGLPNATNWSVSEGQVAKYSNGSTISFLEPNGTYVFSFGIVRDYRPLPSNFTVHVTGRNLSFVVIWVPVLYPVTFVESGLPGGTFWNVTLGNETKYTSNSTVEFKVMNGTYTYNIPTVDAIASSISNGSIKVDGFPTKVFLRFVLPVNFTFYEQGLPTGSHWSVFINGHLYNSTSPIITVALPNETYSYVVVLPLGYYANPAEGSVNSTSSLILVRASSFLLYEIVIAVLIVLIAVFLTIYIRNRKKVKKKENHNDEPKEKK